MKFPASTAVWLCIASIALCSIVADCSGQEFRRRVRRDRDSSGLKKGQEAPDFDLTSLDGKEQTKLSDLYAKKPVVLFFGSYT